jgi:hypothetical protein
LGAASGHIQQRRMQAELLKLGDVGLWQFETEERFIAAVVDAPDIAPARTKIHKILW